MRRDTPLEHPQMRFARPAPLHVVVNKFNTFKESQDPASLYQLPKSLDQPNDGVNPLSGERIPGSSTFKTDVWKKALPLMDIKDSIMDAPGGGKTVLVSSIQPR